MQTKKYRYFCPMFMISKKKTNPQGMVLKICRKIYGFLFFVISISLFSGVGCVRLSLLTVKLGVLMSLVAKSPWNSWCPDSTEQEQPYQSIFPSSQWLKIQHMRRHLPSGSTYNISEDIFLAAPYTTYAYFLEYLFLLSYSFCPEKFLFVFKNNCSSFTLCINITWEFLATFPF